MSVNLETDSGDYQLLYRAANSIKNVPGAVCEIGTRRGGSLKFIIDGLLDAEDVNRNVVCLDPYGNIEYADAEGHKIVTDYTNQMRNEAWENIHRYVANKPVNVVFFCLEDTEFFNRFADGVPFYRNHKEIINQYSLVFFDGPHDTPSLFKELEFFYPRSVEGTWFVFDDVMGYPHDIIHEDLLKNNFALVESGPENRKKSYIKLK
jgi:cephalosporin hydroxylase